MSIKRGQATMRGKVCDYKRGRATMRGKVCDYKRGRATMRGKVCDYKKGAGNLGGWETIRGVQSLLWGNYNIDERQTSAYSNQ